MLQKNFHDKDGWNNSLCQFTDKNIFQTFEWGELKKLDGWEVLQIAITDNETLKCILIAQVLIKRILGIKVAWCPGGPLIQCDNVQNGINALDKFQEAIYEENIFNLRCKPYMRNSPNNHELFSKIPKSKNLYTSSKSNIIKIVSDDNFLKQVKKKHRYYIKQSEKSDLIWKVCQGSDTAKVFKIVYDEMKKNKNLNLPIIDIDGFSKILGYDNNENPRLFTYAGFMNNTPVSVCLISILDGKAFYHYAASTERGRELSASYGMIYNLIKELKRLSIDELDFGGISSDGSSAGVDFFKLGFNGDELSKLGEFDISKSKVYSYFFNKLLQFKKNT